MRVLEKIGFERNDFSKDEIQAGYNLALIYGVDSVLNFSFYLREEVDRIIQRKRLKRLINDGSDILKRFEIIIEE
ncbi:MAG: hypothetical protein N4A40_09915 [Tissierellales bacterium]|nr:hypothetical protein [Tissierellales bacterium]